MIAGIASGLSDRFGVDVTIIRVALVLAGLASGFGVTAYVLAWLLVPFEGDEHNIAGRALSDHRGIALALTLAPPMVFALVLSSVLGAPFLSTLTWATFTSAAGIVLVYRNADEAERSSIRRTAAPFLYLGSGTQSRRTFVLRLIGGAGLLAVGLVFLVLGHSTITALRPIAGALLIVAAIVVLFGPWWLHLAHDLVSERQARARAEERADMAARVHDSVLQTLALIQRAAYDPRQVAELARAQERELRSWLFDGTTPGPFGEDDTTDLAAAVEQIAREVEGLHPVAVDNVTVGDCPLDPELRALMAATREATLNAAKWSGAPVVSIYSEVEPRRISVYVRDRGSGFDRDDVAPDRRGISESIEGRMTRHGGTAAVQTVPGEGTEVELVMPRRPRRLTMSPPPVPGTPVPGEIVPPVPRVFIVDDHALFRAGVRSELGTVVEVIGEADEVPAAIEMIGERQPDVVLVDVHMPGGGGQAVIEGVGLEHPAIRFLALSVSDAPEDVIAVVRAGARGYVTKTISGPELIEAVIRVAGGDAVFSPRLAGFVLDAFALTPEDSPAMLDPELDQLSPREREVLRLIARGFTYKEIGAELTISTKTVESHVSSVLRKLQLSTRHQLTRWAAERRLI